MTFPPLERLGSFGVDGDAEGGKGFRFTGGEARLGAFVDGD